MQYYNKSLVPYESMEAKLSTYMDIFQKIERVLTLKKVSSNQLIKGIGITSAGWYKMKRGNDMKVSTLENVCQFLNISVSELLKNELSELANLPPFEINEPKTDYGNTNLEILKDLETLEKTILDIKTKLK